MLDLGPDPTLEHRPDGVAVSQTALPSHAPAVARDAATVPALPASPVSAPVVQPLSPGRYKVQFTASAEFHEKLEKLRTLMGSRGADGDLAAVIEQAVTEKLERLEARRFARTSGPRKERAETETETDTGLDPSPSSRHIPAAVRRSVSQRDGERCRYVDDQGRRCKERDRLEFHHRHPFGLGGDHSVSNIRLMCRAHNAYLAECDYGREAMTSRRRSGRRASLAAD
jgi:5-methylcytosine-specific restriction endonuclease McrA